MWNQETLQAALLGVIQGLTEFLPISSSAHLILVPWLLGWESLGITFDVVVHGGTLLAILIYFREDWKVFASNCLKRIREFQWRDPDHSMVDAILVGTVPAILVALLFRGFIEEYARTPLVTVGTLSFFGVLLWLGDRRGRGDRAWDSVSVRDGLFVGMAQAMALIPGVSRSGITITLALFLGFSREDSARFSFLLGGPIIALGALNGLLELFQAEGDGAVGSGPIVTGLFVSFVVGFLCIKYFLKFLEARTFVPFVVYRFLLAAVILGLFLLQ